MGYDSETAILNRQDFDTSFTTAIDKNQTAKALLTPTSGKLLSIRGVYISTAGSSGTIRLYFATSANTVIKTYVVNTPCTGYVPVFIEGARNEALSITSTVGDDNEIYVQVNYKEVD